MYNLQYRIILKKNCKNVVIRIILEVNIEGKILPSIVTVVMKVPYDEILIVTTHNHYIRVS
jgi:hypothetical protein